MSRTVLALITLLALPACGAEPPRPPVVLIVFDALGAHHVGHLGYERDTTPHLDALARDGVSFAHCVAPAPYTLASIPSLLTGRLPDVHGVTNTGQRLRATELTLAERLSAVGYRTLAAVSQPNGGASHGNGQGFDEFHELWIPESPEEADFVKERTGQAYRIPSAADFVAFTRDVLTEPSTDAPLFLYLHVLEPHTPFQAPPELLERWQDPGYDGPFDERSGHDMALFYDVIRGRLDATDADVEQVRALYDANLAWADHNLGRIRAELERAGLWDDAVVVVTSDHGEACWEHDQWGHNWELYEEFVGVPLVVKLPSHSGRASRRGHVARELVSTMDVVPTLCELLDLSAATGPDLSGVSLVPVLEGAPLPGADERELILRTHHDVPHLGLRTPVAKTILRQEGARIVDAEHYRLDRDPGEQRDLSDVDSAWFRARVQELRAWYVQAAKDRSADEMELTKIEQALLDRLGYAGD